MSGPFHFYLSVFRFVLFCLFFLARGGKGGGGHRIKARQTQAAADRYINRPTVNFHATLLRVAHFIFIYLFLLLLFFVFLGEEGVGGTGLRRDKPRQLQTDI